MLMRSVRKPRLCLRTSGTVSSNCRSCPLLGADGLSIFEAGCGKGKRLSESAFSVQQSANPMYFGCFNGFDQRQRGKIVGTRFAIIDLPEPGGPIMRMIGLLSSQNTVEESLCESANDYLAFERVFRR